MLQNSGVKCCQFISIIFHFYIHRVATPYGGFDRASKLVGFKLPKLDFALLEPELRLSAFEDGTAGRPSFNRTAQGWTSNSIPIILKDLSLEVTIPETDDL